MTEHTVDSLLAHTHREGDCCIWNGTVRKDGYAQVRVGTKKVKVTRLIYQLSRKRPINPGRSIVHMHECVSSACIHPGHLLNVPSKKAWQYRKNEGA